MAKRTNKKASGGTVNRPQRMTPKAGVTVKKRRLGEGGTLYCKGGKLK